MRGSDVVVGVDLGTGSMKGVAVTAAGSLLAQCRAEYPMLHPRPGWNENDPADWLAAFERVVRELAARSAAAGGVVRAVGIVGQRDPLVMLDEHGVPTAPAISWTDQRARAQLLDVVTAVGRERIIEITGNRPVVGGGLVNVLWAREHWPDAWGRTVRLAAPKDYLLSLIGGGPGTDPTTPTRSLAFDVRGSAWSREILDPFSLPTELFDPACHQPWEHRGALDREWAERLGVPPDVVLAGGSADDHSATVGAGALGPGQVSLGTGTCSSWRLATDEFVPDSTGRVDCSPHAVPGRFIREVTIDSVGSTLRWVRDELFPDAPGTAGYEHVLRVASEAPVGAGGVQCFPFVDGAQRAPFFEDRATGVFIGLTSHHTRAHLARAVLEAVAMLYVPTWQLLGGGDDAVLTIVDGEAASPWWNQLKADVLGHPIRTPAVLDAASMGAAVLAAVAGGLHRDVPEAVEAMVGFAPAYRPDAQRHAVYAGLTQRYVDTFTALRPAFRLASPLSSEVAP